MINFEIYEKMIKDHNKLHCNEFSNENIKNESIRFTNLDLCTKNVEGNYQGPGLQTPSRILIIRQQRLLNYLTLMNSVSNES